MSNTKTKEREAGKRQRVGFTGHRTRLQLTEVELKAMTKSGYRPYWFNEDQVDEAIAAGYIFVKPEEAKSVGQFELHEGNSDLGEKVSKIVTKSNPPVRAFLMKTLIKNYEEDQKARERQNAKVDEALRGGEGVDSKYGSVDITHGRA